MLAQKKELVILDFDTRELFRGPVEDGILTRCTLAGTPSNSTHQLIGE